MYRALLLFLISCSLHAETVSICAFYNWKPWIYPKGDHFDGVMIEQLELFKENNPDINVEIKHIENWKRCQVDVAHGTVTMILGANKTPERELLFDYLPTPAFINETSVGAYTAADNKIAPIHTLEDLKNYSLVMRRGNSFGIRLDTFINNLPSNKLHIVNAFDQAIKLVGIKRMDYFFAIESTISEILRDHHERFPKYSQLKFKKIHTVNRATPVYYVFGKRTGNYEKYAEKWLDVIAEYNHRFIIEQRIQYHRESTDH